jgi:hypothetical protein
VGTKWKNGKISLEAGAYPYLRDLPDAELHVLDTGRFALEDDLDGIAPQLLSFLDRTL